MAKNKTTVQVTDTQIQQAMETVAHDHNNNVSLQKVADAIQVMYNLKISRQGVHERILKSIPLSEIYYGLKSEEPSDNPVLVRESRDMFRGTQLPNPMDVVSLHTITPDAIRGRRVFGEVPLTLAHYPSQIVISDHGKRAVITVNRLVQHD